MNLLKRLFGSVTFNVFGGRTERFLNECVAGGIPIQKVRATQLGCTASVPLRYYLRLHPLARRQRCRLRVCKKEGAFFLLWPFRARWGIAVGFVSALILLLLAPRMVWSVQFYNFTEAQQMVLRKQLYDYNICEGSMPTQERLIAVQQTLFVENTAYSWVKLNFVGGKLVVEKVDAVLPPEMIEETPASIVALCDGVIERVEVDGGFIERKEGQSVAQGDVIVSAVMVGRRGKLHTQRASARVYAAVERSYEVTQPLAIDVPVQATACEDRYALYILDNVFSMPFAAPPSSNAKAIVLRSPLALFGLPLPATVVRTQYRLQNQTKIDLSQEIALDLARTRIYDAIASDLPECELRSTEEQVETTDDFVRLRMKIAARANIASVQENWNA